MVIDRMTFLQALTHEQPWSSYRVGQSRTIQLTSDAATLVYRVTARRDGQPELAGLLTSVYVERADRWRLVLHQQTPMST
jgi:hypothetical protein